MIGRNSLIARNSSRNSSRDTSTVKSRILQHLDKHPRTFLVKQLVDPIGASKAYIRRCLRDLSRSGVIYCKDLGVAKEYSTKCYFPANLYRVKQSPDAPLPQVHGLTMTTKYDIARLRELGIGIGTTFKFNTIYKWKWQPGRIISYKYGKNGTLTVYLQATLNPLNFEDFKHFITGLEWQFRIPTWSQLDKWTIVQYGLNKDIFTMQTNEQITLSALGNFFMQVYDRKILDPTKEGEYRYVQRLETHVNEPIVANAFVQLFQAGVSSYIQQQLAFSTNQLTRDSAIETRGLTRAIENLLKFLRDPEGAPSAPIIRRPKDQ